MSSNCVLITGASGYIGNHVLNLLIEKKYEIHAISRIKKKDNIENHLFWHQIDLLKSNQIGKLINTVKPKYLIHLAWKVGSGLNHESLENDYWLSTSKELITSFYKYGGQRVLVSGTCAEYDWSYNYLTENETPLKPLNSYGEIKKKLYNYLSDYCTSKNYSFIWVRIFFSFGPDQNKNSLVPFVIKKLINNQVVNTTEAQQKFDYLYVEDVASALVLSLESGHIGAVNIASGKATKLKRIILQLANYLNKNELIKFGAVPYAKKTPMHLIGNNEILINKIGWKPKFTIEEGLLKTIKYYKKEFS